LLIVQWITPDGGQRNCPKHVKFHFENKIRAAAGSGWNCSSVLILLLLESYLQTWMTYTIAECTVNNSWWWAEEPSETGKVSFPK
jgi:hypothetical protein